MYGKTALSTFVLGSTLSKNSCTSSSGDGVFCSLRALFFPLLSGNSCGYPLAAKALRTCSCCCCLPSTMLGSDAARCKRV